MRPEHRVTIETERLTLEPFARAHAVEVTPVIGHESIADTTSNIPHPYTEQHAHGFADVVERSAGGMHAWLLRERSDGRIVGGVGLQAFEGDACELGYWVGVEFWGRGFATEAVGALLGHAFGTLGLARVHACYFSRNPPSRRVMEKLGMTPCAVGTEDGCVDKRGVREPIGRMEITREAWSARADGEGG